MASTALLFDDGHLKLQNSQYPHVRLRIGDVWQDAPGEAVINPFDESVLGQVPHAGPSDLSAAVAAARAGFALWRATDPAARCQIVQNAAALMRDRADTIGQAITRDQGKPIAQARAEVLRGCEMLEWDAQEGRRLYGRVIPSGPGMRHTVLRHPIGVVAAFSPWNFPFSSPARKIAGALSAGCALILKPPEETPAAAYLMTQAFVDAGLPPGVLNLVYGNPVEISEFLISHPDVRMIAFTGSTPVGKHLSALAGRHMKSTLMELGGHAPVIICGDTDPVMAADLSVAAKSRNAGQVCVAPTRFYVQESIFDAFAARFAEKAACLKQGDGLDPATQLGPLANPRRLAAMQSLTADAVEKGARLLCGGGRTKRPGFHFPLTVLADVPDAARIMQEEPFGPIAVINRVSDLNEAIARANSLPYGLAGYAFTNSARDAYRLGEELEVGNLSINHFTASVAETPFGGVKDSGHGREGGVEGVEAYTIVKTVSQRFV